MAHTPTHNLLGMIGFEAESLQDLFGQSFKDVDPRVSKFLQPSFDLAQTALGELPGLRSSFLGQLTSGLQERGAAAGRGLQARRAGAGFAGSGALDRLGATSRRGLEQEFSRGSFRIGQDIAQKEAGILGTLSGKVSGFLQSLLAAGTEAADGGGVPPVAESVTPGFHFENGQLVPDSGLPSGALEYKAWFDQGIAEGTIPNDGAGHYQEYQTYLNEFGG